MLLSVFGCMTDYKKENKIAAEKIRLKLLEGNFDGLYNENVRAYITKREFIENMQNAVKTMKEFDESLNWQQDEGADEHRVHEVYGYDNASWRTLEKNGKRLNITIWWSDNFSFCDLTIDEDFSNKPKIVVSRCSQT